MLLITFGAEAVVLGRTGPTKLHMARIGYEPSITTAFEVGMLLTNTTASTFSSIIRHLHQTMGQFGPVHRSAAHVRLPARQTVRRWEWSRVVHTGSTAEERKNTSKRNESEHRRHCLQATEHPAPTAPRSHCLPPPGATSSAEHARFFSLSGSPPWR